MGCEVGPTCLLVAHPGQHRPLLLSTKGWSTGHTRKQLKYYVLVEELLERAGWEVEPKILVITVGVRGTVQLRNIEVLEKLGVVDKRARSEAQLNLAQ
eukprot:4046958-Pyramimonas_sp.AAC.2